MKIKDKTNETCENMNFGRARCDLKKWIVISNRMYKNKIFCMSDLE